MPRVEPVLIFDLDGTILARNSFPVWAGTMLGLRGNQLGLRHHLALSLKVQRLLWQRKLGQLDHDGLLWQLQMLWQTATGIGGDNLGKSLQATLVRMVRPNIRPILQLVADDAMDGILATAAAADYAAPLGRTLGFTHIIATQAGRSKDEPYNAGPHKRDRVLALLRQLGWAERPRIFLNDDMADLPLMQASHAVCWYGSNRGLRRAKNAAPNVRFLPCRGMRANETVTTIAHLTQSLAAAQLADMPWVFPAARARSSTSR